MFPPPKKSCERWTSDYHWILEFLPTQLIFKMVTKSKLKMALLAEKDVDFKKLRQKKLAKKAQKEKKTKTQADEWEEVEEGVEEGANGEDREDEGVELEGDDSGDDRPAQVCYRSD
jgi:rRNA-processing protein EBP2